MKTDFNGKLSVKSLLVTGQPATRPDVQARLLSPGGELAVLSDGQTAFRHLNYLQLIKDKVRGNHYHKLRHEYFYIISGEVQLHTEEIATGRKEKVLVREGDLIFIAPEIAHAFLPATDGHALEFAAEAFDATDVYRHLITVS